MKIKSIIIDDEKNSRENLRGILERYCSQVQIIGEEDSVKQAINLIEEQHPDLVFLDIEMPQANGFKLLEHFAEIDFEVIFVTAYDSYAIKAIRFSAADYILKPINYLELQAAVEKVSKRLRNKENNNRIKELQYNIRQPENPRIGLATGDQIEFVKTDAIVHCKGEGNYTHVYLDGRKNILVAKTLVEFEELLGSHGFIRTHKSHLVNLQHVVLLNRKDGGSLQLSNGDVVSVSRRRKELVLKMLNNILSF